MTDTNELVAQFKSHVNGKNADVRIYMNRIEWELTKLSFLGKAAAVSTMGASLIKYRPQTSRAVEMIPVSRISSVTTKRDGLLWSEVTIITVGNTVTFRVSHEDARLHVATINSLMLLDGAK